MTRTAPFMTCTGPVLTSVPAPFEWTEGDQRAVDAARLLAAGTVQKAGNGHPGTAMRIAPAAYTLFHMVMRHDPADPDWSGRDRFVLSAGHSSLTLCTQLYPAASGLDPDDPRALRTQGPKAPGHPGHGHGHATGIETTSGPLGQGVAHAVGMAMAARYERAMFDPEAAPGTSPFDHYTYAIAGDGCLQEGIAAEASSMAGHRRLGNLVLLWDDNHIPTGGDSRTPACEDILKRYEVYGWHVQRVRPQKNGDLDPAALYAAIEAAKAEIWRPSFIAMCSTVAWPTSTAQNHGAAHGSTLGEEGAAATRRVPGAGPDQSFGVSGEAVARTRRALDRGARDRTAWERSFAAWRTAHPDRAAELDRIRAGTLPAGREEKLPEFETGRSVNTRAASDGATADENPSLQPVGNPTPEAARTHPFGGTDMTKEDL